MVVNADSGGGRVARNIRLYPWFQVFQNLIFWMPVFFLFFISRFDVSTVLVLEAIYYAVVVIAEVPSGYFSDRLGRRITLLGSALCWVLACLLFCVADSFLWFALAQGLIAAGMALRSGSDSALLFESLKAVGEQSKITEHEARAQTWSLLALALAAVVGGLSASVSLQIPYLLTALAALLAMAIAWRFVEPSGAVNAAIPVGVSMRLVLATRGDPVLMWALAFSVALTVLIHIPYEMLQPYVGFVIESTLPHAVDHATPLLSGVLLAVTMAVGAFGSVLALRLAGCWGVGGALMLAVVIISLIIFAMALAVHWLILPLVLMRSLSAAIARPLLNGVLHQRLPDAIRATYLSFHSLLGRLAFSLTLFGAAALLQQAPLTLQVMRSMLSGFALLALLLAPVLLLGVHRLNVGAAIASPEDQASDTPGIQP